MTTNTLVFGTFTFPNRTFQIISHRLDIDTPVGAVPRLDGGEVLQGSLTPRMFAINGKLWGTNRDSVHNELITLQRAIHNSGAGASFYYRPDRYVFAQLSQGGMDASWQRGLYEYMLNVDILMVAKRPFAESITTALQTGSRSNSCGTLSVTPSGNYPTQGVWTIVSGATWSQAESLRVVNLLNSQSFIFYGPMVPGQTLIIDQSAGSVLFQVGLTMVDAISLFGGNLFMQLTPGFQNDLVVCGPTLNFSFRYRDRYYS